METNTKRVEIYVDGALVYTTREPVTPLADAPIREASEAVAYFEGIRTMSQEVFAVMSLDAGNHPIRTRWVTVGLLDSNQVHPREVFADPISDRAASILVAHNHPSGTLEASPEDLALTQRLVKAGELLGIRLLDHVIVTASGFLSLRQLGVI